MFGSIRSRTALLFIPLIVVPLLVGGIVGAFYFQDVLKHHIWGDEMGYAEAISAHTASYVAQSVNYLESVADRPLVIKAVENRDQSFLNETAVYAADQGLAFDAAFITDDEGVVLSYDTANKNYANRSSISTIGQSLFDRPYVGRVLDTSSPVVTATGNDIDGSSTVYVGVPIRDNNTTIGTVVGIYDMQNYTSTVMGPESETGRIIYVVNGSGHIIVHNNKSYMNNMADFTSVPAVREAIQGNSGVMEQYNPVEKEYRLAAYYPVNSTGWGVVVAVPMSVAYQPITNVYWAVGGVTLALIVLSLAVAYWFSRSITDPIQGLYNAAQAIAGHGDYKKYLPLDRRDEVGQVAVVMDNMAHQVREAQDKVTAERDRAELYLDLMGHDIRNMNQVSMGYLELALDSPNIDKEDKELLSKSLSGMENSTRLIENVRKMQKAQTGELEPHEVDVSQAIMHALGHYSNLPGVKISFNHAGQSGCRVMANDLLPEVFENLVGNAVKHAGPGPTINVIMEAIRHDGINYCKVTVEDTGPGIPDEKKTKIFYRMNRGTQAKGSGLGLYLVKTLVEGYGGKVWVEDRVKGDHAQGARFVVLLPAVEK